jgi:hypothetical protein
MTEEKRRGAPGGAPKVFDEMGLIEVTRGMRHGGKINAGCLEFRCTPEPHQGSVPFW